MYSVVSSLTMKAESTREQFERTTSWRVRALLSSSRIHYDGTTKVAIIRPHYMKVYFAKMYKIHLEVEVLQYDYTLIVVKDQREGQHKTTQVHR